MIIAVTSTGRVELREAHDFRAFKIIDEQGGAPGQLSASLGTLATLTPDGAAAWVSQDGVRGLLGSEATQHWLSAFEAMIASARKFGWVNDTDRTVRAHIERCFEIAAER